jgi:hypothetical protein
LTLTRLPVQLSAEQMMSKSKMSLRRADRFSTRPGRLRKDKAYAFNRERFGKTYSQKRVEVVYVMEQDIAVTVTVYVFFGEWKDGQ